MANYKWCYKWRKLSVPNHHTFISFINNSIQYSYLCVPKHSNQDERDHIVVYFISGQKWSRSECYKKISCYASTGKNSSWYITQYIISSRFLWPYLFFFTFNWIKEINYILVRNRILIKYNTYDTILHVWQIILKKKP